MVLSPEQKARRWLRFSALLTALALILFAVDYSGQRLQDTRSATLYRFDHDSWTAIAPAPARSSELGTVFQGQLWLATEAGVFRFDGSSWVECPQALKTRRPAALAASAAGVWALDIYGNLSHFDGTTWRTEGLAGKLPGVTWGTRAAQAASLAAGDDGTLWILWDGLWHYSEGRWAEVRPEGHEVIGARLLGGSAGAAWLAQDGEISEVSPAGGIAKRLHLDLPGIAGRDVYRAFASAGNVWFATAGGFAVSDGTAWRNAAGPPQAGGIVDATAAADGTLFVVAGKPPASVQARIRAALPLLFLSGGIVLLLIYLIYSSDRMRDGQGAAAGPTVSTAFDPRNAIAARRTRAALSQADYRGAMRKLQRLSMGLPSRQILLLQALVLSMSGQPEDAERRCRRALGNGKRSDARFALDRLSGILIDMGKFEEARECLERAISLDAGFDLACLDRAQLMLMEGDDPQQALELAERALEAKPSPAVYCTGRQTAAEIHAVRAWAFAALGRRRDAEVSTQRALDRADQNCPPVVAGIYWRLGRAMAALGDRNAAMIHLRNTALLDPQGKYGDLARAEIEQLSASVTA